MGGVERHGRPVMWAAGAAPVTLNQLEIFATVAREGSFTRAGEVLVRSQAAISQQIKLLEAALGTKLIERPPGRPLHLTDTGRLMLASCEAILHELETTMENLEALKRAEVGQILIGSGAYFGSYLLPSICASFQQTFPGIRLHVRIVRGEDCLDALREGDVDLVVTGSTVGHSSLGRSHLAQKSLVWIARSDHELSSRTRIPFGEILTQDLVVPPATSSNRRLLDTWASDHGWRMSPNLEVATVEAQVTAVRNGLGIAAVPWHALSRYEGAGIRVLSVDGFPLNSSWSVVWRDEDLSRAGMAFRDHLLSNRAEIERASLYEEGIASSLAAR